MTEADARTFEHTPPANRPAPPPPPPLPDERDHERPVSAGAASRLKEDPEGRLYDPMNERGYLTRRLQGFSDFFEANWHRLPPPRRDEVYDYLRAESRAAEPNPPALPVLYVARQLLAAFLPPPLLQQVPLISEPLPEHEPTEPDA